VCIRERESGSTREREREKENKKIIFIVFIFGYPRKNTPFLPALLAFKHIYVKTEILWTHSEK
jgi:hypothetical protein